MLHPFMYKCWPQSLGLKVKDKEETSRSMQQSHLSSLPASTGLFHGLILDNENRGCMLLQYIEFPQITCHHSPEDHHSHHQENLELFYESSSVYNYVSRHASLRWNNLKFSPISANIHVCVCVCVCV
jgi:hypothetical protein